MATGKSRGRSFSESPARATSKKTRPGARDKSDRSSAASSKTSAHATVSGPARSDSIADMSDAHVAKADATQALAAKMPFNPNKAQEHGKRTVTPPQGIAIAPTDPSVGGSTLTETNASDKV